LYVKSSKLYNYSDDNTVSDSIKDPHVLKTNLEKPVHLMDWFKSHQGKF